MKSRAHFRVLLMPCCGQMLCWVNPRLPNYCPECGKFIYAIVSFALFPANTALRLEISSLPRVEPAGGGCRIIAISARERSSAL